MTTERYEVSVKCSNCGYEGSTNILRGIQVEVQECPNCGCKGLKRKIQSKKFKSSK